MEDSDTSADTRTIAGEDSQPRGEGAKPYTFSAGDSARIDRFTLLSAIGRGGMGELYAAYDAKLDRKVALKLVRSERVNSLSDSRLVREAQALAQISHPNVVPVFEVGSAGERVFVAMEYVRGRTLGEWLAELEAGSETERVAAVVGRFLEAARGLAAVHEAGLAHRDFKPANVIVGDDGRVRLVDFGLARSTGTGTWTRDGEDQGELLDGIEIDELLTPNIEEGKLTSTGALLGTPRYMAPEQWQAQRGDSRSDQFSFCVALYHALYGEWPYSAKTSDALSAQMLEGGPTPPPPLAGVPESLRAAVLMGLEGEAEERNRDMGALIEAMEETLRPPQRRQGPMLAVLAVLLVILSVALVRLVVTPEAEEGPGLDAWLAELVREREAEAQRVAVVEQVAELEAQGEFERADEAFEAFAGLPANASTNALVRAWMDRAAQLGARDLGERQLAALGEALLESSSEAERRDVLFALARIQAASHDYARLGATLLVLEHEEGNAELLTMRAHEALNRRALDEALEALARPELAGLAARVEPLVRQLDRVTRTGARSALTGTQATAIVDLPGLDLDGDGHGELLFVDEDRRPSLRASGPELRWLSDLELPFEDQSYVWIDRARHEGEGEGATGPSWVGVHAKDGHALVELTQVDERVVARALTMGPQGRWAAGELFAGPGWEGWEAVAAEPTQRRITGLRGTAGEPERFEPTPSLAALDSYVDALLVTDLDGDGDEELVAGVDGWWAYDVRVFSPGAEPGHFELEARDKLGGLSGMVSFAAPEGGGRWLAVTVPESPPSPRVFSSDAPAGAPPGVYLMRWPGPGQALERVDQLALPTAFEPRAGDLDGDGDDELVVELMDGIVILQPGEALGPTSIRLSGLRGQAIVDLDHDGDDELIVRELETGEVLVLGSGSASLPSLDAPLDPRIPPDPGLEAELRPLWARAETLAMVGLADQSAAMFTKLARLANEDSARSARVRSAALLERSGARERAAALYEQAGVPSSLARALEIYRDLHQFEDARRVAERLAEGGDAAHLAEAQTLRRWAEPETSLDFDLRAALDEGWHIEQPGVLRSEPRGLRVDLLNAPDSVIVHRPFEWDGDHLALEFELTIERLEWGSMLHVDLLPEDEHGAVAGPPLARVRIAATGGGGHYILDRAYNQSLEPGSVHHTPRMRAAEPPPGQRRIRVTLDLLGEAAEGRVRVDSSGGDEAPTSLAYRVPLTPEALAAGRYRLALTTGADSWMRGVVQLESLHLGGARAPTEPRPLTRRERVGLALANADSAGVLELIADAKPGELEAREADWLAALALEQEGQWTEAQPYIQRALGDCRDAESVARFGYGLLLVPDRFGPSLRAACPEVFIARTWEVAWGALFHHPDLVDVHRTLTTQLPGLDGCEPRSFEEARACADLLTARSRGWYMQNQGAAADTDLRRALALIDAWKDRPELSEDQRRELRRIGSLAHVRLGAVLVIRNLFDEAEDELAAALDSDLAPEIIADVIVARSLFEPLYDRPIWKRVLAVQAGLE